MSTPFREKEPPLPLSLLGLLIEYWDEICICLMGLLAYPPLSLPIYICLCCDILKREGFSHSDWMVGGLFIVTPIYFSAFFKAFSHGYLFSWSKYLLANAGVLLIGLSLGYLLKERQVKRRFAFLCSFLFLILGLLIPCSLYSSPPSAPVSTSTDSYHSTAEFELEEVPKTTEITGSLSRTVYWTPGGESYHFSKNCTSLKRSRTILSGTLQEALDEGKTDPCNLCAGGS